MDGSERMMAAPASARVDYLASERQNPGFDVDVMRHFLAGGKEKAERVAYLAKLVSEDPVFSKAQRPNLTRPQAMRCALHKAKHLYLRTRQLGLNEEDAAIFRYHVDEICYADLHWFMFIPAIEGQATAEQAARWLPLACRYAWIGCYAQTELGHGSNVQGLETTATYMPFSEEFELHSPTLTSTKWWPGGLGKCATHAIVYARLVTAGKDHGVHAFLVPLRSLEDHRPLPGITVADVGTKFGNGGYNTMDNGLLCFAHVRIPRDYLLAKYARVTKEGVYERPAGVPRQLGYGAMVAVRRGIVVEAGYYLSRAVTIAVRYSAVRRQFGPPGQLETKVIDYQTQQHRLLALLATAYALRFAGRWVARLYTHVMGQLAAGDFSQLPEVHACTAGLKSLTTGVTADGIEECRKLCGGHGYLCASGLPELFAAYVPACTYEGDNTVLMLQVARYLVKTYVVSVPGGTAVYLHDPAHLGPAQCRGESAEDFLDPGLQLEVLSARAARQVAAAASKLADGVSPEQAFAENSVELARAARAHCQRLVFTTFREGVLESAGYGAAVAERVKALCDLYALSLVEADMGDFLETGCLSPPQAGLVREQVRRLLAKLRPSAVALVDAFGISDHLLGSALGRADGDVYTHLYQGAWLDPINEASVIDGYEEHLRPLIRQEVWPEDGGPQARL